MAQGKKTKPKQHVNIKKQPGKTTSVSKDKYLAWLFGIVLIAFISFLPVLQNGFVNFDDDLYLLNNKGLASINPLKNFSQFFMGNYHPLTMLVYSIEYQFFELNATGYHAISLLLHLLNTMLVFFVILKLSNKKEVALLTSLLFGIHPMHVESVAWAAELKDLLYSIFFLTSWLCYLNFVEKNRWNYYLYCLLFFLLSLFSKAMAVSLPLILLLTDYLKGRKLRLKVWLEKIPFFAISLIFGVVAILAQKAGGAIHDIDNYPLYQRLVFACYGFIAYPIKLLIPYHYSVFYPYPGQAGEAIPGWYYFSPLLLAGICYFIFYSLRVTKKIFFASAFFAITVFLVLQILPVGGAIIADRYIYIPSIGLFFLAAEGILMLWKKRKLNYYSRLILSILAFIIIFVFPVVTYTRCQVWKNSLTLWNDVISKFQKIPESYYNRGVAFDELNQVPEAMADFSMAIRLEPGYAEAYANRGLLLKKSNKFNEAMLDFSKAIELKPDYALAYINRSVLLTSSNRFDEAIQDCNKAIELQPGLPEAYSNRGTVFAIKKQYAEAHKDFDKALELNPNDVKVLCNRGRLFMIENKYAEGLNDYNKAIELQPDYAEAFYNRGLLLKAENKCPDALQDFTKAIQLKPDYSRAFYNKAECESILGRKNEACLSLQAAIKMGMREAYDLYNKLCIQ